MDTDNSFYIFISQRKSGFHSSTYFQAATIIKMTSTLTVAYYHYDYGLAGAGTYYNIYMWGQVYNTELYALMKTAFVASA